MRGLSVTTPTFLSECGVGGGGGGVKGGGTA